MSNMVLSILDQVRYITGTLLIVILACHRSLPKRDRYYQRLSAGCLCAFLLALAYVPLQNALADVMNRIPVLTGPYWLVMSFVPVCIVLYCYETNLAGALFRTLAGAAVESFVSVLIRYLLVQSLFPMLPRTHPYLYGMILIAVYALIYYIAYTLICRHVLQDESRMYPNVRMAAFIYLAIYLSCITIQNTAKVIYEYVIPLIAEDYPSVFHYLQFFLITVMLLLSFVIGCVIQYIYTAVTYQNEKQIIRQMLRERQAQYDFSRENVEMINRKAHDLKHQLRALEMVTAQERREQIREARQAIDFYDAVVKTGNEALDTLLTEKSVYCINREIRLSCIVNTTYLERINLVDLYTLLGNAIDNAIESVEKLEDPEKKTISLTIRDQGRMLFMNVENYYTGELHMENGVVQTSKQDKENHGFGMKSMQSIVRRYGGSIMAHAGEQIFSLEILIPEPEPGKTRL